MDAPIRIALALVLLATSARASLQLVPREAEEECEGVKLHCLAFFDGSQRITYAPPRGWRYSGSADRFVLQPARASNAEAVVRVVELPQPQIFDEATLKRLSQSVLDSLPASATKVTIVSEEKDPLLIERKETFLVVVNYECYNIAYARSLMFLNRKNEQVQFQLTSPRTNFPQLQKEFLGSLFSWQNL